MPLKAADAPAAAAKRPWLSLVGKARIQAIRANSTVAVREASTPISAVGPKSQAARTDSPIPPNSHTPHTPPIPLHIPHKTAPCPIEIAPEHTAVAMEPQASVAPFRKIKRKITTAMANSISLPR